jgi:PAS domain S-box-containing protein
MALLCCADLDTEAGLAWLAGPAGAPVSFNIRSLDYFGLSAAETSGWQWQWAVHPADLPTLRRAMHAAWGCGEVCSGRFRLRRGDGAYRWHIGSMTPVCDERGRQAGWLATCDLVESRFAIARTASTHPVNAVAGG